MTATRTAQTSRSAVESMLLGLGLTDLARRWRDGRRVRAATRELAMLTDRELADLGIHRTEIDLVIRGQGRFAKPQAEVTELPAAAAVVEHPRDLPKAA